MTRPARAPLGIRLKVLVLTFGVVMFLFLAGVGVSIDEAEAVMNTTDGARLHVRVTLVALAVAASAAIVVALQVGRWVASAVEPLTQAARSLGEGDLDVRPVGSPDLGELSRELERLSRAMTATMNELRAQRDLQKTILEGMQEGVLLLDVEGNILIVNRALREMLALAEDVVGSPLVRVAMGSGLEEIVELARKKRLVTREIGIPGEKPRRVLVRAAAREGQILAVFVDVTEIRRLESLRRDFVANVSHELRTPVTSIRSSVETLRGGAREDPSSASRFLEIIDRNAERLHRLVEDLLDLARLESGQLELHPDLVPLSDVIQQVFGMSRERADAKRMDLVSHVPEGREVWADPRALEQLLVNLVDNAVKYCQDGATIAVDARDDGGGATLIEVADTGPGIAAEHLPRLFERFYRVDAGRSRAAGGTGLGLAIVKHLAEAFGGSVRVSSVVGEGTRFSVTLPPEPTRRPSGDPRPSQS